MNIAPEQAVNHYLAEYNRVAQQLAGHDLPWLQEIKQQALADFTAQGFPTVRHEDWKYTNIAPITKHGFQLTEQQDINSTTEQQLMPFLATGLSPYRLVFINGHFSTELSTIDKLPAKVTITSLAQALVTNNQTVKDHLNKITQTNNHAFKQLNTILMQDGAFIHLAANVQLEQPIYLIFINTETQSNNMNALRNLIIMEENAQASIIESYISISLEHTFTNAISEIFLNKNAQLNHYKLQQENTKAFHVGTVEVQQQEHSHFTSHSFALGGALVRSDINIDLAAEHAFCALNGLYLAGGKQHIDHHTSIKHAKPHDTSRQYYKGVLMDRARAVFNGKVFVAQGAYKTDAQQTNKNLLLSSEAEIDTKPQLEIYADDVQCTHGAAIGQLDENALFYLRARGINDEQARSLLIYAFIQELFEKVPSSSIRQHLQTSLTQFLPAQIALEKPL